MSNIDKIIDLIIKFRDERDWSQFHNSKDLSIALSIEASELNELFLWKNAEEVNEDKLKEELADILIYALLISKQYDFNIEEIIKLKLEKNEQKYPIEKAKGSNKKYSDY